MLKATTAIAFTALLAALLAYGSVKWGWAPTGFDGALALIGFASIVGTLGAVATLILGTVLVFEKRASPWLFMAWFLIACTAVTLLVRLA